MTGHTLQEWEDRFRRRREKGRRAGKFTASRILLMGHVEPFCRYYGLAEGEDLTVGMEDVTAIQIQHPAYTPPKGEGGPADRVLVAKLNPDRYPF